MQIAAYPLAPFGPLRSILPQPTPLNELALIQLLFTAGSDHPTSIRWQQLIFTIYWAIHLSNASSPMIDIHARESSTSLALI